MNRFLHWLVLFLVMYRITCLRVILRELENFLYDAFLMFSVVGWTWKGFCRDLDPLLV